MKQEQDIEIKREKRMVLNHFCNGMRDDLLKLMKENVDDYGKFKVIDAVWESLKRRENATILSLK